jgi:hypothetical protein
MSTGYKFNEWNLPLDQEPHCFMNFTQWKDKLFWEPTLKRLQKVTSTEWDLVSWMTSDFEVEIGAQIMDNVAQRELFCYNFSGH